VQEKTLDGSNYTKSKLFAYLIYTDLAGLKNPKPVRLEIGLGGSGSRSSYELKFSAGANWTSHTTGDGFSGGGFWLIAGKGVNESVDRNKFDLTKVWDELQDGIVVRVKLTDVKQ